MKKNHDQSHNRPPHILSVVSERLTLTSHLNLYLTTISTVIPLQPYHRGYTYCGLSGFILSQQNLPFSSFQNYDSILISIIFLNSIPIFQNRVLYIFIIYNNAQCFISYSSANLELKQSFYCNNLQNVCHILLSRSRFLYINK